MGALEIHKLFWKSVLNRFQSGHLPIMKPKWLAWLFHAQCLMTSMGV